jgi:NCAIR mutase (PurE)-related protein
MDRETLLRLLRRVAKGDLAPEEALPRLSHLPFEDLGFARLDHHRLLRRGFPEAVYGEGKTPSEIAAILEAFSRRQIPALVTRLEARRVASLRRTFPALTYHPRARLAYVGPEPGPGEGLVLVVSGGTSAAGVAEEAFWTARYLGARAELRLDVGVAGLHRLAALFPLLLEARVVVAVAGMEGALPSVVAGLTGAPVIGVPTSVGYGVQDGGKTPLFSMLASCVPGLLVVNVDAGFSAGYAAALLNRLAERGSPHGAGPRKRKP